MRGRTQPCAVPLIDKPQVYGRNKFVMLTIFASLCLSPVLNLVSDFGRNVYWISGVRYKCPKMRWNLHTVLFHRLLENLRQKINFLNSPFYFSTPKLQHCTGDWEWVACWGYDIHLIFPLNLSELSFYSTN